MLQCKEKHNFFKDVYTNVHILNCKCTQFERLCKPIYEKISTRGIKILR